MTASKREVEATRGEWASPTVPHRTNSVRQGLPERREQRLISIDKPTCQQLREHMMTHGVRDTALLFTWTAGTPLSRNNFRTKYWARAVKAAKINQAVTFHNLRAAHDPGSSPAAPPVRPQVGGRW
ncbi:MAG: hypothetical protein QOJ03_1160 [Frankiaceae bacterium]|nr:hypothetical protein [Frankiaceae bacterium]